MLRRSFAILACALALVAFAPSGNSAASDPCANFTISKGSTGVAGGYVTGALSTYVAGACTGGGSFSSATIPCPGTGVSIQPGEYCGPTVGGGATVTCSWDPIGPVVSVTGLVIGFDTNFDGSIDPVSEGATTLSPSSWGSIVTKNPFSTSARVIAYPTSTTGATLPSAQFYVGCA